MNGLSARFQIGREVTGKVIDGEAVIIDLSTGVYYSLASVGSRTWELIEAGLTVGRMAEVISKEFGAPVETVRRDLDRLLEALQKEGLIEPGAPDEHGTVPGAGSPGRHYSAPELMVYNDMADLLALDPPVPGLMPEPWQTDPPESSEG